MTRRVVVLAGLLLAACGRPPQPKAARAAAPPPLPADVRGVEAAAASPAASAPVAAVEDAPSFNGELVSPVRSDLAARIPGRVARVLVDVGAHVRTGQPLLELETEYLALDVRRAEADLQRATAAGEEAARDFERKRGLIAKESVSQAAYDRSQGASRQAEAARAAAAASLDLARQRLADAVLASPLDGVVVERRADIGERLGDSTVAFVLQQIAPLKLRFQVPERYLGRPRVGQPVKARVEPYPGEVFRGTIAVVGDSIDPATRTFLVEAEFPNRDGRLLPGLFARVETDLKD